MSLIYYMTNVTLSIEDSIYKKMKKYSEIKWSEYIRKKIKERVDELDKLGKNKKSESIFTMLASEKVLKKDWDNEADERWNEI
jgi:hypothetical protein